MTKIITGTFTTNNHTFTEKELVVFTKSIKDYFNRYTILHTNLLIEEAEDVDYYLEEDELKTIYSYDFTITLIETNKNKLIRNNFEKYLYEALEEADTNKILLDYHLD